MRPRLGPRPDTYTWRLDESIGLPPQKCGDFQMVVLRKLRTRRWPAVRVECAHGRPGRLLSRLSAAELALAGRRGVGPERMRGRRRGRAGPWRRFLVGTRDAEGSQFFEQRSAARFGRRRGRVGLRLTHCAQLV